MKKYLISFISLFILFSFAPIPAFAHFAETDGTMTVTLHVSPNDDPIAGKQAQLYFLFRDTSKKFGLADCLCTVSVTESGKRIDKRALIETENTKKSIWGVSMPYIFPDRNVYHIVLSGIPEKAHMFQPFTVSWNFRVDPVQHGIIEEAEEPKAKNPPDGAILAAALAVVIVGLIFFGIFIKKEYTSS